ncbi:MAG: hypothetical protein KR126chlam1_00581 [Chlamydiae bacterium]|nr:hypothetical protein [Chlamydiota bacterium]
MFKFHSITLALICASTILTAQDSPLSSKEVPLNSLAEKKPVRKSPIVKTAFAPFTGKVVANKVRVRLHPDLDSFIIRELGSNEYLSIVDQEEGFYSITPPSSIKAYVFRSFVLDGIVEGNRVNVRLSPDLEAPIIGHLNSGDRVNGHISLINKKWLEIDTPQNTQFYVAKEFLEFAGGPELKAKMDRRKDSVSEILQAATLHSQSEMEKEFEEIDFEMVKNGFLTIINEYSDFPKQAGQAKETLAAVQEIYLQKRIAYLEEKAALVSTPDQKALLQNSPAKLASGLLHMWENVEQGLYASWAELNDNREMETFYEEQKLVGVAVAGVLEAYNSPVRNKPGDFIIKDKNLPVAYVYSTCVDLGEYVGKKVKMVGSPRSNNSFAFPAYYIHTVE